MWMVIKWVLLTVWSALLSLLVFILQRLIKGDTLENLPKIITFFSSNWELFAASLMLLGILVVVAFHRDSLSKFRRRVWIYKRSGRLGGLRASDINRQPKWYHSHFVERGAVDRAVKAIIEEKQDVLLLGAPLIGKTRCALQVCRSLKGYHVLGLDPGVERLTDLKIPRSFFFFLPKLILFLDNLQDHAEKFRHTDPFDYFSKQATSLTILATCRSGQEFEKIRQNESFYGHVNKYFQQIPVEELSAQEGEELAKAHGRDWEKVQFNGTPGSIVFDLEDMLIRLHGDGQNRKTENILMRVLYLMQEAGIRTYKRELTERIAEDITTPKEESPAFDDGWLWLQDNGYLSIAKETVKPTHTIYLEPAFNPRYTLGKPEADQEKVWQRVSADEAIDEIYEMAYGSLYKQEDFQQAERALQRYVELLPNVAHDFGLALCALSACRAFDCELYCLLGRAVGFQTTPASFQILTEFLFVWPSESRGEGWYRVDGLLRRMFHERDTETTQQAHELLERYYRERIEKGDETAVAEAIYHANQQDWRQGVDEWMSAFEEGQRQSRSDVCVMLLAVRAELSVETHFVAGQLSLTIGDYFASLSRHDEARQEYQAAVLAYEEALIRVPSDVAAHISKGDALQRLGEVQARLSPHSEAMQSYRGAIAAYEEALIRVPSDVAAHISKGDALQRLGEVQARLWQHIEAMQSYGEAIAAYEEALRYASNDVTAHNNKGAALQHLGEVQAELSQHIEAMQSYGAAIAACEEALQHAPNYVGSHVNKGNALRSLGNVQAVQSQYIEATQSYEGAIAACEEALRHAPNEVAAHMDKGVALQGLGEVQARLAQYSKAMQSYGGAIAAYEEALRYAPNYAAAHNNKGNARQLLGNVQAELSRHIEAMQSYGGAIAAYEEALRHAPNDVTAHNNKGNALRRLGEVQARLLQHIEAMQSYEGAIAACEEALRHAPNYVAAHINTGMALQSLGEVQARLAQYSKAMRSYGGAIAACEEALRHAPNYAAAHISMGIALRSLGDVQAMQSQHIEATQSYEGAIAVYKEALRYAPNDVAAHRNTGVALQSLGEIQARSAQTAEAQESFRAALAAYSRSLEIAPDDVRVHGLRSQVQEKMDSLPKS